MLSLPHRGRSSGVSLNRRPGWPISSTSVAVGGTTWTAQWVLRQPAMVLDGQGDGQELHLDLGMVPRGRPGPGDGSERTSETVWSWPDPQALAMPARASPYAGLVALFQYRFL